MKFSKEQFDNQLNDINKLIVYLSNTKNFRKESHWDETHPAHAIEMDSHEKFRDLGNDIIKDMINNAHSIDTMKVGGFDLRAKHIKIVDNTIESFFRALSVVD